MSEQVGIGIWESRVIGIEENSLRDSKRRVNFTGLNHFYLVLISQLNKSINHNWVILEYALVYATRQLSYL